MDHKHDDAHLDEPEAHDVFSFCVHGPEGVVVEALLSAPSPKDGESLTIQWDDSGAARVAKD